MAGARPSVKGTSRTSSTSCGGLVRDDTILLPYGAADATVGFALIDLPGLLHRLRGNAVARPLDDTVSQVVG